MRNVQDPTTASKQLVDHALNRFSTDNLSCMIVRLDKAAVADSLSSKEVGVEADASTTKVSEADKIVAETKQQIAEGNVSSVGVSASNSGRGHDAVPVESTQEFVPTTLDGKLEEEPAVISDDEEVSVEPRRNNIVPKREEEATKEKGDSTAKEQ